MTPHHTKDSKTAVSDLTDGTGAPVVTEAMIEAGIGPLLRFTLEKDEADTVREIYLAMEGARVLAGR